MRRRSRAGGEPAKAQRRKTGARKNHITPKGPRSSPAARKETKVARLTRELKESLAQQAATADVLQVISRSTFDLAKVLNTLVEFGGTFVQGRQGCNPPTDREGCKLLRSSNLPSHARVH